MFYKNAKVFCGDFSFHHGAFEVVDGKVQPAFYKEGLTREEIIYGYRLYGYADNNFHVSCKPEPNADLGTDEETGATVVDNNRTACTSLLFVDGFEFKDDYPYKF